MTSQRIEFENLKSESVVKAPATNVAAFDVLKRFEKPKKNIELTFSESKEKLYASKLKKEDTHFDVKRVMSPVPSSAGPTNEPVATSTDATSKAKALLKSNSTSSVYQTVDTIPLKDKTRDKLNRPVKPNLSVSDSFEVGSELGDNKISLPKLRLKQGAKLGKLEEKESNKKGGGGSSEKLSHSQSDENKEAKETARNIINFDDDYVQVSQLKSKVEPSEKVNKKAANTVASTGDVKLTFLSRNTDEKNAIKMNSFLRENTAENTRDSVEKEAEQKQRWLESKKAENTAANAGNSKRQDNYLI